MSGITTDNGLITPRQKLFLIELMKDPTQQTEAARKAGYKNAKVAASRFLNGRDYPVVRAEWDRMMEEKQRQAGIELLDLIRMLANVAQFNIQDITDEQGRFLPVHQLPRDVAACIQEVETSTRIVGGRDGSRQSRTTTTKLKAYSKLEAIKQIALLLGWLKRENEEAQTVNNTTNNTTVNMNWGDLTVQTSTDLAKGQIEDKRRSNEVIVVPPPAPDEDADEGRDEE